MEGEVLDAGLRAGRAPTEAAVLGGERMGLAPIRPPHPQHLGGR